MTAVQDIQHLAGTDLSGELRSFCGLVQTRSRRNRALSMVLVALGFGLGAATVIAGVFNEGHLAACLAAMLAAVIGIERAFGFDDSHRFQELLLVEGEILQAELKDSTGNANVKRVRIKFHSLKRNAVATRHGQMMAAVSWMYKGGVTHPSVPASTLYRYDTPVAEPRPRKKKPPRRVKGPVKPVIEDQL